MNRIYSRNWEVYLQYFRLSLDVARLVSFKSCQVRVSCHITYAYTLYATILWLIVEKGSRFLQKFLSISRKQHLQDKCFGKQLAVPCY